MSPIETLAVRATSLRRVRSAPRSLITRTVASSTCVLRAFVRSLASCAIGPLSVAVIAESTTGATGLLLPFRVTASPFEVADKHSAPKEPAPQCRAPLAHQHPPLLPP